MRNYGLDLKKEELDQKETDWMFGAADIPCLTDGVLSVDFFELLNFLPVGEVQQGKEDMMDCATRSPINNVETKLNILLRAGKLPHEDWFRKKGYIVSGPKGDTFALSDAFIAILSGTTKFGNSIKAPIDAIRKRGLIPKSMLPLQSWMTWDDYHDPSRITGTMYALGQEFLSKITINYQRVPATQFKEALDRDMLCVGGHAWPTPKDKEYPRTEAPFNHAWLNMFPNIFCFDNYIDSVDGDFVKKLAPDYLFYDHGYRIVLGLGKKENWWDFIFRLIPWKSQK